MDNDEFLTFKTLLKHSYSHLHSQTKTHSHPSLMHQTNSWGPMLKVTRCHYPLHKHFKPFTKWPASWLDQQSGMCCQRGLGSACTAAQNLWCQPEDTVSPESTLWSLIRLGREPSLKALKLFFSCNSTEHEILAAHKN